MDVNYKTNTNIILYYVLYYNIGNVKTLTGEVYDPTSHSEKTGAVVENGAVIL